MEKAGITLQTKISELLEDYPSLETKLLELSPVFSKLKNPILRRTVARVTSLQQAAMVAGINPILLVKELRTMAGLSSLDLDTNEVNVEQDALSSAPDWFVEGRIKRVLDARPIIDAGGSPMQEILRLANELGSNEILRLTTSFRPQPIIDVLKSKGFEVWSKENITYFVKIKSDCLDQSF